MGGVTKQRAEVSSGLPTDRIDEADSSMLNVEDVSNFTGNAARMS